MEKTKKKPFKTLRVVFLSLFGLLLAALAVYVILIIKRPQTFFQTNTTLEAEQDEAQQVSTVDAAIDLGEQDEDAALSELQDLIPQGSGMEDEDLSETEAAEETTDEPEIINVLLCGIDAYEQGGTTSGTVPHTDAMMVISINLDEKKVDIISVARDLLTTAPDTIGYYKLNCVFNAGGGMQDIDAGLSLTSRELERWLGGISIPYYYALDFQAVIDIVNAIGGVDFNVDQSFTTLSGYQYYKGQQHLDGDAVLGYIRVRQQADGLDSSRTERQRKMIVAIFDKLKSADMLTKVPELINSAKSGIYTNTDLSQTAALAAMAVDFDSSRIYSHSIQGTMVYNYTWRFCFCDQQARLDLIRDVYGIEATPIKENSAIYERWLMEEGFADMKCIYQAERLINYMNEKVNGGYTMSATETAAYKELYASYLKLVNYFNTGCTWAEEMYTMGTSKNIEADDDIAAYQKIKSTCSEERNTLMNLCLKHNSTFGTAYYMSFNVPALWNLDEGINRVPVDFG